MLVDCDDGLALAKTIIRQAACLLSLGLRVVCEGLSGKSDNRLNTARFDGVGLRANHLSAYGFLVEYFVSPALLAAGLDCPPSVELLTQGRAASAEEVLAAILPGSFDALRYEPLAWSGASIGRCRLGT